MFTRTAPPPGRETSCGRWRAAPVRHATAWACSSWCVESPANVTTMPRSGASASAPGGAGHRSSHGTCGRHCVPTSATQAHGAALRHRGAAGASGRAVSTHPPPMVEQSAAAAATAVAATASAAAVADGSAATVVGAERTAEDDAAAADADVEADGTHARAVADAAADVDARHVSDADAGHVSDALAEAGGRGAA